MNLGLQTLRDSSKEIKENILSITLVTYGIGLIYEVYFYSYFNVPIIYYCSLNDLLLFSVTEFLPIIIITVLYKFILTSVFELLNFKKILKSNNRLRRSLFEVFFTVLVLFCLYFFTRIILLMHDPKYILLILCPALLSLYEHATFLGRIFFTVLVVVGLVCTVRVSEQLLKTNDAKAVIQFKTKDGTDIVTKDSIFVYVGETSNALFLYNCEAKSTSIFLKNDISDLQYVSSELVVHYCRSIPLDLNEGTALKSTHPIEFEEWQHTGEGIYSKYYEINPRGLNNSYQDLKEYLFTCGVDYNRTIYDGSFATPETQDFQNLALLDSLIKTGKAEINKGWKLNKGRLYYILGKNEYEIRYDSLKINSCTSREFYENQSHSMEKMMLKR